MNIRETYTKSKQLYQFGKEEFIKTSIMMKDTGKNLISDMNSERKEHPLRFYLIGVPIIASAIAINYYLLKDTPQEFMQALHDAQK